jgi:hypothetical protein
MNPINEKYQMIKVCQAKINGVRVECGECGAMLFKVKSPSPVPCIKVEIKCKHRSQGQTCNSLNIILL